MALRIGDVAPDFEALTSKGERLRLPISAGSESPAYLFESLDYPLADRRMEGFLAVFPEGAPPSEAHQHGVEELVYVLEGTLSVIVDEERTTLAEGDAMSFDSSVPHTYHPEGRGDCTALVVTVA